MVLKSRKQVVAAVIILIAWTSYSQTFPSSPLSTVVFLLSIVAFQVMRKSEACCKNQLHSIIASCFTKSRLLSGCLLQGHFLPIVSIPNAFLHHDAKLLAITLLVCATGSGCGFPKDIFVCMRPICENLGQLNLFAIQYLEC